MDLTKLITIVEMVVKAKNTRPSGWLFRLYYRAKITKIAMFEPAIFLIAKKVTKNLK